jgi:hypothetical protein
MVWIVSQRVMRNTEHENVRTQKKKKKKKSRVWWCTPLIPALGRKRQADF